MIDSDSSIKINGFNSALVRVEEITKLVAQFERSQLVNIKNTFSTVFNNILTNQSKTSPASLQPKHLKIWRSSLTWNDGVFS